jgi:nitrite reductase/ring-hydroxylating ferredoxin subunit
LSGAAPREVPVCRLDALEDPGCKEFRIGEGDWPFKGFVVRQGDAVYAYQNFCMHAGHPLNWREDSFLTGDGRQIICASHGAIYDISRKSSERWKLKSEMARWWWEHAFLAQ